VPQLSMLQTNLGILFRFDPDGSVHRKIEHVGIPNGNAIFLSSV
jgi:hypothetical protein